MRGLRGREVISGRKPAKNGRKLVSIRGTVSLINSVRRDASRITATAAKAVGLRSPAKSGLNLIYTTHFLAPGGSAYLRDARGSRLYRPARRDGEFPRVYVSLISLTRSGDVKENRRRRSWAESRGYSRRSRLPTTLWFPLCRITEGTKDGRSRKGTTDGGLINCSTEEGRHRMTCCGSLKVDGRKLVKF